MAAPDRSGARARGGGVLRVQGGGDAAGARRRARVGARRDPGERRAPRRRLRHRPLDARAAERACHRYGVTVEEYKRRNLLSAEVTSDDVAAMVGAMCTEPFAATTGAQVPVDGGNERVI